MSKLTQGHINCLANWMLNNPGKKLNVSGTWRNNGYEVLNGYQTGAKGHIKYKEQGSRHCKWVLTRKLNKNIDEGSEMITKKPDEEIKIELLEKDSTGITKN